MEALFTSIWRGIVANIGTISVILGGLMPAILFGGAVFWHLRKEKESDPPQTGKLLHPPGHSLSEMLDETADSICLDVALAGLFCLIAAPMSGFAASAYGQNFPYGWTFFFGMLAGIFASLAIVLLIRASRRIRKCRNLRLGLRGEQAAAEAIHEAADVGYRAFHDLPAGDKWNIDHVVVGTRGLFVIETKARRRRTPKRNQRKHEALQRGEVIQLPFGNDNKSIPQAARNARWLTDYLAKKTGEPVSAEALVVMPGWYVQPDHAATVKAMNQEYMVAYLRNRPERIEPAQVRRIITALEEKCRTLEF